MNLRHFDLSEFDCKCGQCEVTGRDMDECFLAMLDEAREQAGLPFVVESGMRCEAHNMREGGSPSSSHLDGYAADIRAISSRQRFFILDALIAVGVNRIGIAETYIHADNDPNKPSELAWLY